MSKPAKTPWGRPVVEAQATDAWGRPIDRSRPKTPTVKDFRDVGLSESDATAALEGLTAGRYLSFEDACLATSLFGEGKTVTLREDAMREKARQFSRVES